MIKSTDNFELSDKVYKLVKSGMYLEDFCNITECSLEEAIGLIELCKLYGKNLELFKDTNGKHVIQKKSIKKTVSSTKPDLEGLTATKLLVISDTHIGNTRQQLHLVNELYKRADDEGIKTVLHCGDFVDGDYMSIRKEQVKYLFLRGFDELCTYSIDMWPKVKGIETKSLFGSHDETTFKNGSASIDKWITRCRPDIIDLGYDRADIEINKVKITMWHPGAGCGKYLSTKLQDKIELLESGFKPKVLLTGHYHKSYFMEYRNVYAFLIPALCDYTHFQDKMTLKNMVGGYIMTIYSDSKGNIQYLDQEEILYGPNDFWDEAGKDKNKVKQLVIN